MKRYGQPRGLVPVLLAIAMAAAAQTAILPWLPTLVDSRLDRPDVGAHDLHIAILSAVYPLGGLALAPIWGWLAERYDYRPMLRWGLVLLALVTAATGVTTLPALYVLRALAGIAAGAIIPLCLLVGGLLSVDRAKQARLFTLLTASLFLGDMAGPMLAEISSRLTPRLPLFGLGACIAAVSIALLFVPLPSPDPRHNRSGQLPVDGATPTLALLAITIVGAGGLAAIHVSLLVNSPASMFTRDQIGWMLSLCGLAMFSAQLFHTQVSWVMTKPIRLSVLLLAMLALALAAFVVATTPVTVALTVVIAGWSAASLRLVSSFWISGPQAPSALRLGLQHAVASIGQAVVPLGIALAPLDRQNVVVWLAVVTALGLALALPLAWRPFLDLR